MTARFTTEAAHIEFIEPLWLGPTQALKIAQSAMRALALGRSEVRREADNVLSITAGEIALKMLLPLPGPNATSGRTITVWIEGGHAEDSLAEVALALVVRALAGDFGAERVFWPLAKMWCNTDAFVSGAAPLLARRVTRRDRPAARPARPVRRVTPTKPDAAQSLPASDDTAQYPAAA